MKKYIYIGVISLLLGFATYLFLIFQNGKKLDGEYYVISDNKMELAFTINKKVILRRAIIISLLIQNLKKSQSIQMLILKSLLPQVMKMQ